MRRGCGTRHALIPSMFKLGIWPNREFREEKGESWCVGVLTSRSVDNQYPIFFQRERARRTLPSNRSREHPPAAEQEGDQRTSTREKRNRQRSLESRATEQWAGEIA